MQLTIIDKGEIMSKIKDQIERDHDLMRRMAIEFAEFLESLEPRVYEVDTDEEEEDSKEPSTPRTSIVSQKSLKPANKINYNPNRSIK